jgi:hypothetical protein
MIMRKTLQREVTHTTVQLAKLNVVDGVPTTATLPEETLVGNYSLEKAQKEMTKKHGVGVTVFGVQADTKRYEMDIEKFIELATEVQEDEQQVLPL